MPSGGGSFGADRTTASSVRADSTSSFQKCEDKIARIVLLGCANNHTEAHRLLENGGQLSLGSSHALSLDTCEPLLGDTFEYDSCATSSYLASNSMQTPSPAASRGAATWQC